MKKLNKMKGMLGVAREIDNVFALVVVMLIEARVQFEENDFFVFFVCYARPIFTAVFTLSYEEARDRIVRLALNYCKGRDLAAQAYLKAPKH